MFVVYDNPMQVFAGNPSQGMREPEFMELIGHLPTTWDETVILDGKIGEYIVTARQKDNSWFVGGMGDWSPRDLNIRFDFLGEGEYTATVCTDGVNADRYAADYQLKKNVTIKKGDAMPVHLAPGGGFLIRLDKK
jgi:alpha-glucosidase